MKKINPDTPLTDKEWKSLGKPMHGIEQLPDEAKKAIAKSKRGRPYSDNPKTPVSIRLDADLVKRFRATGKGWQSKMNQALHEWLESHPI